VLVASRRISLADLAERRVWVVGLLVASHVVIGVAASRSSLVGTLHAVATLGLALGVLLLSNDVMTLVMVAVYMSACDVFWRMTHATVPWEMGKYGLMVALLAVSVRFVRNLRAPAAPLVFMAMLIPSVGATLGAVDLGVARGLIATNLSGPLSIAVAVVVFRQLVASEAEAGWLLWCLLAPIVSIAAVATTATSSARLDFTTEANFAASGGFGPNQVASVLGFGVLLCLVLSLRKRSRPQRLLLLPLGAWFAGQALITFSRGGILGAVAGALAIAVAGLATRGTRSKILSRALVVVLVATMVFSWVNAFSLGGLERRYGERSTTGRTEIAVADLQVWAQHPLFGTGPGLSSAERLQFFDLTAAAHTEYTRLLSEHGLFGLVAIVALVVMAIGAWRSTISAWNRLFTAALLVWAFTDMAHAATRVALVGIAFGLANLRVKGVPAGHAPVDERCRPPVLVGQ